MTAKYFITTFGCQMNVHDSEVLAGLLESLGYGSASSYEEADLILINTCCVRENAENRTFGHIGNLKALKNKNPDLIIGICGCMVQQPSQLTKIKELFPQVDLVFGTHNLHQFPELLARIKNEKQRRIFEVWDCDGSIYEGLPVKRDNPFKAWVTIMYGCNNFCSYCIVPYVRGRERSRRPEAILEEVRGLVKDGVREVTLLGQNVNSYGKELAGTNWSFARLLREIARNTGIRRVRFQTSHPKDLSDELIATIAAERNIGRHLHLPVQAGSTRVLKLMNRQYGKEQYEELVAKIKGGIAGIALTTDIIVGFPGEQDQDFRDTMDLVKKIRFDGAFTFVYSPRIGTPAAQMSDNVPELERKLRLTNLIKIQTEISLEKNQAYIGTLNELLVDGPSAKNPEIWSGRNSQNKLVHFQPTPKVKPGDFINVKVTRAQTFTLEGEVIG
jgi:tRNA-2-methylthio-N6-dimethylallyladenosine synthase